MNDARHRSAWSRPVVVMGIAAALLVAFVVALPNRSTPTRPGEFRIVCTFLPVYVLTLNLVQDAPNVSVELLLDPGSGCPHDYSVHPGDVQRVANANLVVASGLGIDGWVDTLAKGSKARVVQVSEGIDPLPSALEDPGHDVHAASEPAEGHRHGGTGNPHVWASPRLAAQQARNLSRALAAADPSRAQYYSRNEPACIEKLNQLTARMEQAAKLFKNRRIATFHDAFAYLARDLGLDVVATLTADPEQPPSARQMLDVIERIRQTRPAAIFYEPAYGERLAQTVSAETGVPIYPLNPFNSVDGTPDAGSYERVMDANLQTLKKALGGMP